MRKRRWRLSAAASTDIKAIVAGSRRHFGTDQAQCYADLLARAADCLADNPGCPCSRDRGYLAQRLRSFHVALSAGREAAEAHVLVFRVPATHLAAVSILRVLRERMDPTRLIGEEGAV